MLYLLKKKKKKNPKNNIDVKLVNTCFNLEEQFLQENESQKSENLKMLRKSPALNAWILQFLKMLIFPRGLNVTKWSKF